MIESVGAYYAIVRKRYINLKTSSLKAQRRAAIDELNEKMNALMKTVDTCYFDDDKVLILWDGYKDEQKLTKRFGLSNDYLISNFCMEIREQNTIPKKLYIPSPTVLKEPDDETPYGILRRLLNIWKESSIIPVFLQDNFLEMQSRDNVPEEAKPVKETVEYSNPVLKRLHHVLDVAEEEAWYDEQIFKMDYEYFCRFFTSIEKLLVLSKVKKEAPRSPFVELYFKWQAGELSVDRVVDEYTRIQEEQDPDNEKAGISSQTWYRHKDVFENSPYYPEYVNAHRRLLIKDDVLEMKEDSEYNEQGYIKKKIGTLPGAEPFLREYKKAYDEYFQSMGKGVHPEIKLYEMFDEIHSVVDVPRVYEALVRQPEDLTTTGFMKHILEERNKKYSEERE